MQVRIVKHSNRKERYVRKDFEACFLALFVSLAVRFLKNF